MDCSSPASSVHGVLLARILEWDAISYSRGSFQPRDRAWVSCNAGDLFTVWVIREVPFGGQWTPISSAFQGVMCLPLYKVFQVSDLLLGHSKGQTLPLSALVRLGWDHHTIFSYLLHAATKVPSTQPGMPIRLLLWWTVSPDFSSFICVILPWFPFPDLVLQAVVNLMSYTQPLPKFF